MVCSPPFPIFTIARHISTIDHILCPSFFLVERILSAFTDIHILNFSDHVPVFCLLNLPVSRIPPTCSNFSSSHHKKYLGPNLIPIKLNHHIPGKLHRSWVICQAVPLLLLIPLRHSIVYSLESCVLLLYVTFPHPLVDPVNPTGQYFFLRLIINQKYVIGNGSDIVNLQIPQITLRLWNNC